LISPVTVRLVDERMSTVTAAQGLRASGVKSKKGRKVVDQAAAVVFLQSALETEKATGRPPGEPAVPAATGESAE
jgi:putative Holliday junction resolvase